MQAEYRKEWAETYLQIPCEEKTEAGYEEKMMYYNPGNGLLDCSREWQDGETVFRYKVTGKKALHSIYATLAMEEEQIRSILQQVIALLETGREYLLSEDSFILEPKYIFTTLPELTLYFCYLPGYHQNLTKQLENLFEYLLNRVDYEDKQAVELLYDCYLLCVRDEAGLREMKQRLSSKKEAPKQENTAPQAAKKAHITPTERQEMTTEPSSYTSWLAGLLRRGKKHRETEETERKVKQNENLYAIKQSPAPPPMIAEERTMLLSEKSARVRAEAQPQLLNEKTGELILISKTPFYIGSLEGYADCIMRKKEISRLHTCIRKKEESYYLSDLNSTNGTFLNQTEVLPGREERLSVGDVIKIAGEEFVFSF